MKKIMLMALALCSSNVFAADFFVQGGLHFGGDDIVAVTFTNGDTEKIKAGELMSLSVGAGTALSDTVEGRIMLGLKLDIVTAKNADLTFLRYPVEALALYHASEKINIGGGLAYHLNPNVSGDGVASNVNINFDNAFGLVLTAEYMLSNGGYLGIKYTGIDYEINGLKVSGNSIGGILGFRF